MHGAPASRNGRGQEVGAGPNAALGPAAVCLGGAKGVGAARDPLGTGLFLVFLLLLMRVFLCPGKKVVPFVCVERATLRR